MGFFRDVFGGASKTQATDLAPDVAKVFRKLHQFLNDETMQNAALPKSMREAVKSGLSVDELPSAEGEFGRSLSNPIPTNGPVGELIYLSTLSTHTGHPVLAHRLGSINTVDVYETVSFDGRFWDLLFLSLYHPRKSRRVPEGYRWVGETKFVYAVNRRLQNFPFEMPDAISACTKSLLGLPLRPPQVRECIERCTFARSNDHNLKLSLITHLGLVVGNGG